MVAQASSSVTARSLLAKAAPYLVIALAGIAVRSPIAAAYPFAALLLFLWIVSDTLMLALIARSSGRPRRHAVLGVLAGASTTVWLGSPTALREALATMPMIVAAMATMVVAHVAWGLARAMRALRLPDDAAEERWAGDRWAAAAAQILPPTLVRLARAELIVIHMALLRWGGPADVPANCRAFPYHRHLTPMCATLLILSAIEIAVYHLLVGHWSRTAATMMFALSDLGFVYLVGLIKSFRFRPVLLTPEGLRVRAGFLIDQAIPFDAIAGFSTGFTGEAIRDPGTYNAALLAWPNIVVHLNRPLHRRSLLKGQVPFGRVAFRLDDPEAFVRLLRWRLGQTAGSAGEPTPFAGE